MNRGDPSSRARYRRARCGEGRVLPMLAVLASLRAAVRGVPPLSSPPLRRGGPRDAWATDRGMPQAGAQALGMAGGRHPAQAVATATGRSRVVATRARPTEVAKLTR